MYQWNRIKNPAINLYRYHQLTYCKGAKNIPQQPHAKEWNWMATWYYTQTLTQNRWKICINIWNHKLLQEKKKKGSKVPDMGLGDDFLNLTPKTKISRWDYIKLKKKQINRKIAQWMKPSIKWKGNLLNRREYLQIIYKI